MLERLTQRGFSAHQIDRTMDFLNDAGLLNDAVVAREAVRCALRDRHLGRQGLRSLLYKRGFTRDLIQEVLSSLSTEQEEETAFRLVEKKQRALKGHPRSTVKRRLAAMLQRRGFPSGVIIRTLNSAGFDKT